MTYVDEHSVSLPAPAQSNPSETIYILVNEAMPGIIKIGKTTDLARRISELNRQTGVPAPFDVFYAARVTDMSRAEYLMHRAFEDRRMLRKEFFRMAPEQARAALQLAAIEEVTSTAQRQVFSVLDSEADRRSIEVNRQRRENSRFSMLGIPAGALLEFRRDRSVTCVVLDDRSVTYDGEEFSLSALTRMLLRELEGRDWTAAQGWNQWMYQGEVLTEIRNRLETGFNQPDDGVC